MNVSLVMFKADGDRRDFPITRGRVVVGRKNTCDLRIPLSSVSRQHCEITLDGDQAHLRDLGSSNGTYLNDTRIQEEVLKPGDNINIGPVAFTVVIDGQPQEVQPPKNLGEIDPDDSSIPLGESGHTTIPLTTDEDAQALKESSNIDDALDDQIAALSALDDSDLDLGEIELDLDDVEVLEDDEK